MSALRSMRNKQPSAARRRIARPAAIDFCTLSLTELRIMSEAGREIRECYRALAKTGDNIVGEVLRDQGIFREWDHYPHNEVYDAVTHAQFYYHRPGSRSDIADRYRPADRAGGDRAQPPRLLRKGLPRAAASFAPPPERLRGI